MQAEVVVVEGDGLHGAASDAGAAGDALLGVVLEQVGAHVDVAVSLAAHGLEAGEVAAAVAVAHAHDVDVLHREGLGHHAGVHALLNHGDGLVLADEAADADLVEVGGQLAEGQAGLEGMVAVAVAHGHAEGLPHQAALAGGDGDLLVGLDDGLPVHVLGELVLLDDVDAHGVGVEERHEGLEGLAGLSTADALGVELGRGSVGLGGVGHAVGVAAVLEVSAQLVELPEAVDVGEQVVHVVAGAVGAHDHAAHGQVVEDLLALLNGTAGEVVVLEGVELHVDRHLDLVLGVLLAPQVLDHLVGGLNGRGADALADAVEVVAQLDVHGGHDGAVGKHGVLNLIEGQDVVHLVDEVAHGLVGQLGKDVCVGGLAGGVGCDDVLAPVGARVLELELECGVGGLVGLGNDGGAHVDASGGHSAHGGHAAHKGPAGHVGSAHSMCPLLLNSIVSPRLSQSAIGKTSHLAYYAACSGLPITRCQFVWTCNGRSDKNWTRGASVAKIVTV